MLFGGAAFAQDVVDSPIKGLIPSVRLDERTVIEFHEELLKMSKDEDLNEPQVMERFRLKEKGEFRRSQSFLGFERQVKFGSKFYAVFVYSSNPDDKSERLIFIGTEAKVAGDDGKMYLMRLPLQWEIGEGVSYVYRTSFKEIEKAR